MQQQTRAAEQPKKASPGFALSASKNRWLLPCKVAAQPSSTAMAELPQRVAAKQPGAALLNLIVSGNGWLLPNIASEGTCSDVVTGPAQSAAAAAAVRDSCCATSGERVPKAGTHCGQNWMASA